MNPVREASRPRSGDHVGLFGGTFDPPTIAHVAVAEQAKTLRKLDQIWLIPAYQNPLKGSRKPTPPDVRIEMLESAFSGLQDCSIKRFELDRGGKSYTIDTLRQVQADFPEVAFSLILGQDNLERLSEWKEVREIFKRVEVVVVTRPDINVSGIPGWVIDAIKLLKIPDLPISSTLVRERISLNQGVDDLVPPGVASLIARHHLYQS